MVAIVVRQEREVEGERQERGRETQEDGEGSGEVLKLRDVGVGEEGRGGLRKDRRVWLPRIESLGWVGVPGRGLEVA